MKKNIIILITTLISLSSVAGKKQIIRTKDSIVVKVQGMVCDFCAQGVEKGFKENKEVKKVKVDLDKMEVELEFHEGKSLSDSVIEEKINSSGFTVKENE